MSAPAPSQDRPPVAEPPFTRLLDLASERLGGQAIIASDDFFAGRENLLKPGEAVWKEGVFTDRGKWMDGWESRRKRVPGHDWCIVQLGLPGVIRGVEVDTKWFRGNFPEGCSLEAIALEGEPSPEELASPTLAWSEILPRTSLQGHTRHFFAIASALRFTHVRLHIYPDGGVARLRVHGEVVPDWRRLLRRTGGHLDLAAAENGARVVHANNDFFGSRQNLIMPGRAVNMGDGWETKRKRPPVDSDWIVLELVGEGSIRSIEVDTNHFKGNFPDTCSIEGIHFPEALHHPSATQPFEHREHPGWRPILPRTKLRASARHHFDDEIQEAGPFTHVRLQIFPDGGVSRLRLFGVLSEAGLAAKRLAWLHALSAEAAERALLACCGSRRWAGEMARKRPFANADALYFAGERTADELTEADWLEAFAAHPRIGSAKDVAKQGASTKAWTEGEQAGAKGASDDVRAALASGNARYEERFGFIYIVCASGKSAEEMLAIQEARLGNDRAGELANAAKEQRKITRIRLEKLLTRPV